MTKIAKEFYDKNKPKKSIKLNLANREKILEAIANTPEFVREDLFWPGLEIKTYLSPKIRKRTEPKLADCLVEIKYKKGKVISFVELLGDNDVRIFFWDGKRSDRRYGKRIFSDDELLEMDPTLGEERIYIIYECDGSSVPIGDFEATVRAKTWKQAIDKIKKERPTKNYYNTREV